MTRRAKWFIVFAITALFPVLLTLLYPVLGSSVNVLCMAAPIVATLFFGLKVGAVFAVVNWLASMLVFSQIADIAPSEGVVRVFIPFSVTIALCFGANQLRLYFKQRKKAENALRNSEQRYRMIFEHSADGIVLLDDAGAIIDASPRIATHVGYAPEEFTGKRFQEVGFFSDAATQEVARLIHNDTASTTTELEVTGQNKEGQPIYLQLTLSRITEHPTSTKWICLLKNTTERRDMMAKLQEAQKMKALGRLAGGIAHDINNILNAIIGSAHAHRHDIEGFSGHFEDLDNITSACNRGAQLTRNLLGFARKSSFSMEAFSVNNAIKRVLSLVNRTSLKNLRYKLNPSESLPLVEGDQNQIENAIMNICLNAQDAMEPGGLLTIETFERDGSVCVQVIDTGSGMDDETKRRVFEPFFTTKPVGKGTGLGLSLAYGVVESHKGSIHIESVLGEGTTVTLAFPPAGLDARQKPDSTPPPSVESAENPLASRTVLLVDDEPLVLRAGQRMLQSLGCHVIAARSGKEAIEIVKEKRNAIFLVILDLIMPDMDGTATLEKIREVDQKLPVLLASGYTQSNERIRALQEKSAACGFLSKPYHPDTLIAAARTVLSERAA